MLLLLLGLLMEEHMVSQQKDWVIERGAIPRLATKIRAGSTVPFPCHRRNGAVSHTEVGAHSLHRLLCLGTAR